MSADSSTYRALVVHKNSPSGFTAAVESLPAATLPAGDVVVRVEWSSLNYKDALSISGHPGVTRDFPHVPGIDAAGTVLASEAGELAPGTKVLVHGFDFGSQRWGGYGELTRVPADWVVPLPVGLAARDAMVLGTAGFTAGQCVAALEHAGVVPGGGPVVVSGASGGVGSLAVALLAKLGYSVSAVSGKPAAQDLLLRLGAKEVLPRSAVDDAGSKPLLPAHWAGAVDTVGGNTLATILRSTKHAGCVTACGLVGGADLKLTVYPFILRGVRLAGIDSAWVPRGERLGIWERLAGTWRLPSQQLEPLVREIGLDEIPQTAAAMLAGTTTGRTVVRIGAR